MRLSLDRLLLVAFLACRFPGLHAASSAQGGGQLQPTRIVCDGAACGGSGGASGSPYLYRVKPGTGASISKVEVGIEDGELGHYTLVTAPPGWVMSIHETPVFHDLGPTAHGTLTAKAGSCPRILRFAPDPLDPMQVGQPQSSVFELGFAYEYDETHAGYHDVHWKASDGKQAAWTFPVGGNYGPVHSPARRNVLLIVLDDVGTDKLRMFDDPSHSMPDAHPFAVTTQLDALAAQGLRFTNFYVNPVCTTTRASIQTGRYSFRHGIGRFVDSHVLALDDCEVTVAELVKSYSTPLIPRYETAAFGKWHLTPDVNCLAIDQNCCNTLGSPVCNPGHAVRNGYDHFSGTLSNTHDHFNDWTKWEHDAGSLPVPSVTPPDDCTEPACAAGNWTANILRADATEWIQSRTTSFFAYLAFNPPHGRYQAPPFVTEDGRPLVSGDTQAELSAHGLEPQDDAGPDDPSTNPDYAAKQELLGRAMLEAVDSAIGYLLADIGDKAANTMVFVVCDNGTSPGVIVDPPHDAQHGKGTVYQLGTRVPMIVSGPLVPLAARGSACAEPLGAVDFWSTFGELAGASVGTALSGYTCTDPGIDSRSFVSLIQTPSGPGPRNVGFAQEFFPNDVIHCRCEHSRGLTDGTFKYIRRQVKKDGPDPDEDCDAAMLCDTPTYTEELYNILDDPEEAEDLLNGHTLTLEQSAALNALRDLVTSAAYGGD